MCACEKKTAAPSVAAAAPAVAPEAARLLIGEVDSLTGTEATYGITTRNGIMMALDEVNAKGGIKGQLVDIRVYDASSKAEEAASAAKRLIVQDKVLAIIGEVASSNSLAMAPIAQSAQIPMIATSSTNPAVTLVGDYIFRACFIDTFQGGSIATFARQNLKLKTVAIFIDSKSAYSVGLAEFFEKKFVELGGKVVARVAFAKGETDFRAQLTRLKSTKPEGLYLPLYYEDTARIALQAQELGFKSVMLGGDGWESDQLFVLAGRAIEGGFFTTGFSSQSPDPLAQKFVHQYQARFGATPDSLSALGYDAARMLFSAMERAHDFSGPAIRDALAATKDFPGVTGSITLDKDRNPTKPAAIVAVKGAAFEFIATINQ